MTRDALQKRPPLKEHWFEPSTAHLMKALHKQGFRFLGCRQEARTEPSLESLWKSAGGAHWVLNT